MALASNECCISVVVVQTGTDESMHVEEGLFQLTAAEAHTLILPPVANPPKKKKKKNMRTKC
jgi:hypothetical protein